MFYTLTGFLTIIALSALIGLSSKYSAAFTHKNGNLTSEAVGTILAAGLLWPLAWLIIAIVVVFDIAKNLNKK